jgi:hypothetical protein
MRPVSRSAWLLSVAIIVALASVPGCAARTASEQPQGLSPAAASQAGSGADFTETLGRAEQAFRDGRYQEARPLYAEALAKAISTEDLIHVRGRLRRVDNILYQQSLAEGTPLAPPTTPVAPALAEPAAEAAPGPPAEPVAAQVPVAEQEAPRVARQIPVEEEALAQTPPEPVEEPAVPDVPLEHAGDVLDEVRTLASRGEYEQTVPLVLGLDAVRADLTAQQKATWDLLRCELENQSAAVPPLTKKQRARRAQQQFDLGIVAYESGDYLSASDHLAAASGFGVSIGWMDNRKLRKVRSEVEGELQHLRGLYVQGTRAYESGDYAVAADALQAVQSRRISLGTPLDGNVVAMLATSQVQLAQQAAQLLSAAARHVAAEDYEAASVALETLSEVSDTMDEVQLARAAMLRRDVANATGRMPGGTQQELMELALDHYEAGMDAYDSADYLAAQQELLLAQRMEVDLGRRAGRLRKTLDRVESKLSQVRLEFDDGLSAYSSGSYEEAASHFQRAKGSGISLGPEVDAQLDRLLAECETRAAGLAEAEPAPVAPAEAPPVAPPEEPAPAQVVEEPAAEEQPEPVLAEEPPAETPAAVRVPLERAGDVLDEVRTLASRRQYEQTVPLVLGLDAVRPDLPAQQKATWDLLRCELERQSSAVPPLTNKERKRRAQEQFDLGVAAYESRDYLSASGHLSAADAFAVGIGWMDNRKLRKVRSEVEGELGSSRRLYAEGKSAYESGDYDAAVQALQEVDSRGISLGRELDEQVAALLDASRQELEQQKRRAAAARQDRVADLLSSAGQQTAAQDYAGASNALEALSELSDDMNPEQLAQAAMLRREVADATGRMPGGTEQELLDLALEHYEAGMAAYDSGDYLAARQELLVAQRMQVDLGRRAGRLRKALDSAESELSEATQQYEAARSAYSSGSYEEALGYLEDLRDGGVSLGPETDAEVYRLLAESRNKAAEAADQAARAEAEAAAAARAEAEAAAAAEAVAEAARVEAEAAAAAEAARAEAEAAAAEAAAEVARAEAEAAAAAEADRERAAQAPAEPTPRQAQADGLVSAARARQEAGDPAGAAALLSVLLDAGEAAASAEVRDAARDGRSELQQQSERLQARADSLVGELDAARGLVSSGNPSAALAARGRTVAQAAEQALGLPGALAMARADAAFLADDLLPALAEARPADTLTAQRLLESDLAAARQTADLYLQAGSPALAEPYLQYLRDQGDARAGEQLAGLPDAMKQAVVRAARAVQTQQEAVDDLAGRLAEAADQEALAEIQRQMDDARLALAVVRAESALRRADIAAARSAVDSAPPGAGPARMTERLAAVRTELQETALAAREALQARRSVEGGDLAEAAEALARARRHSPLAKPVSIQVEALAGVVDALREGQADQLRLTTSAEQALQESRETVDRLAAAQTAFQDYVAGVSAYLAGDAVQARGALASALSAPAGLLDVETRNARSLLEELSGTGDRDAIASARDASERVERLLQEARYVEAAEALGELRAMEGHAISPAVRASARDLSARVAAAEARAEELYAEAVAAWERQDRAEVARVMGELAAYEQTAAYQRRRTEGAVR